MSTVPFKVQVYNACVAKQQHLIEDFQIRVNELNKEIRNNNFESPSQQEKTVASAIEVMSKLEEELSFVQDEMEDLAKIDSEINCTKAERGALVYTDKIILYISISAEEITVNDKKVFCLSLRAPIYKELAGKTAGEKFKFNNTEYNILSIE